MGDSSMLNFLCAPNLVLGWGLLSQFSPFRYFPHFPLVSKQTLAIEYHVYIWQVLPQLSCGDTCQIWMWFRESNRYFCKIENCAYGEISERSFSNPHPWKCASQNLIKTTYLVVYIALVKVLKLTSGELLLDKSRESLCVVFNLSFVYPSDLGQ